MPSRNPSPHSPLPIATAQLARGLIRLHARLRGELLKKSQGQVTFVEPEAATEGMRSIEGVIRLLGVRFDPGAIKPIKTWPKVGPMGYGDLRAEILAALRKHGSWMAYSEMADAIAAKRRLCLDVHQRRHFLQKLREATHALSSEGAVECEKSLQRGQGQQTQRWRLSELFGQ